MARSKVYNYNQGKFILIFFDKQIVQGTFEYTLNYLIDNELDPSVFDAHYDNEGTDTTAYEPAIFLKMILYAYRRGITSSRKIKQRYRENIIFMALSWDTSCLNILMAMWFCSRMLLNHLGITITEVAQVLAIFRKTFGVRICLFTIP